MQAEPLVSPASGLPIQFREGLLWVEVCVPQSKEAFALPFGFGASASVVNLGTARRLGLELGRKVSVDCRGHDLERALASEVIRQGEPD